MHATTTHCTLIRKFCTAEVIAHVQNCNSFVPGATNCESELHLKRLRCAMYVCSCLQVCVRMCACVFVLAGMCMYVRVCVDKHECVPTQFAM